MPSLQSRGRVFVENFHLRVFGGEHLDNLGLEAFASRSRVTPRREIRHFQRAW